MQNSRLNKRKNNEDLELRLGSLARNYGRDFPNLITIEDDENDDVLMYSRCPRTSSEAMPLFPISSSWIPVVTEEDLELRLGSRESRAAGSRTEWREPSQTWKFAKMKYYGMASSSSKKYTTEEDIVKLKCTICMDTMREETSTLCGHVFCKSCITNAIMVQNRCPACRKEVSMNNIHRIYLPGATS